MREEHPAAAAVESTNTASLPSINDSVFVAAQDAFRATLSAKDQANYTTCASPADVLTSLQRLHTSTKHGQNSRLTRCFHVVSKFNGCLQSYFDALNVVISVDDTAALAYGALRIVLQMASALPTFLDKLLAAISRLTEKFPQYEKIMELFDGEPPPRVRKNFEKVYQGFFQFFQLAAKVLNASNGRIRRPIEMLAHVVWKPFDARFGEIMTEMENNRLNLFEEMEIMRSRRTKDAEREASLERTRAERERLQAERSRQSTMHTDYLVREMREAQLKSDKVTETSYQRIREWLAIPPQFAQALRDSQKQRIDGTSQWIFHEAAFVQWANCVVDLTQPVDERAAHPWVLWVNGNPGCGKTTLAASVYDKLIEEGNPEQCATFYFFFDYNNPKQTTIGALYSAILAQILHSRRDDTEILDKFLFIQYSPTHSFGQLFATDEELFDLICICANNYGPLTFVIDGVDEADDPNAVSESLLVLAQTASVKLIYFSRPNINYLREVIPEENRVSFTRSTIDHDIRSFLEWKLCEMINARKLPVTKDLSELSETLLHGADGMFLWAKLMIKYLESPVWSPSARVAKIRSVNYPEALNDMYDRIMSLIMASPTHELELAKRIVMWIQYSFLPLGAELNWLLTAMGDCDYSDDVDSCRLTEAENFASAAITVCGGLVEYSARGDFKFIHLTVREYFSDTSAGVRSRKAASFLDKTIAISEITSRCVQYLTSQAPKQMPLEASSRDIYSSGQVASRFRQSFEAYAAKHWWRHLVTIPPRRILTADLTVDGAATESQSVSMVQTMLSHFLNNPLAVGFWIEDIYSLKTPVVAIVNQIMSWVRQEPVAPQVRLSEQLNRLTRDLTTIESKWDDTLSEKPYLIWTDVMLFTKLETFPDLNTSALGSVTSLAPNVGSNSKGNTQILCSISTMSKNGQAVGVLNIVPSENFIQFWRGATRSGAYDEGEKFCHGWTAQYELWSADSADRLASLNIALSRHEIAILFRQTFRQIGYDYLSQYVPFETSFPMSIGHDCLTICVLRTVYRILLNESQSYATFESCLLPLENFPYFNAKFGTELQRFHPDRHGPIPPMLHLLWRDWYRYSTSFGPDGTYIAFMDYVKPFQTNLAVFRIHSYPTLNLEFIQSTVASTGPRKATTMIFHSQRPLLAFPVKSKVWLWSFLEGKGKEPSSIDTKLRSEDPNHPSFSKLEAENIHLSFSSCGKYILARRAEATDVVRIPEEYLYLDTLPHEQKNKRKIESVTDIEAESDIGSHSKLARKQRITSKTLSESQCLDVGEASSIVNIATSRTGYNLEVFLTETPDAKASTHVLALPNSIRNKDTAIGIKVPENSDNFLTVVVNKTTAEGYTLGNSEDFVHPSIVKKNLRLLGGVSSIINTVQETLEHGLETLEQSE
ncbi:hypothetical protein E8E14_012213 [Neopestalotiopsis sp. 37M]|nr:hypothetical protein E8E14_012213 [Neopestalotiopsis sp. 37M]